VNEIWIKFYFDFVSIGNEIGCNQIWMRNKFELEPDRHYRIKKLSFTQNKDPQISGANIDNLSRPGVVWLL